MIFNAMCASPSAPPYASLTSHHLTTYYSPPYYLLLTTLLLTTHSLAAHDRTTVLPTRCTLVIYLYLLDSPEINQIVLVSYSLTTAIDLWKVWRCSASALT